VLPLGSRDRLAELLSDGEIETLRHLAREGMGAKTLRAMASVLAYLKAWSLAASGGPLPWPAPEGLVLCFIATPPAGPMISRTACLMLSKRRYARVGRLRAGGPHLPSTVRRRLALLSTFHRWLGLQGPFSSPNPRAALRLAARAARRPRGRKGMRSLTRDVLERLIATCSKGTLADKHDAASCSSPLPPAAAAARRSPARGSRIPSTVLPSQPTPARRRDRSSVSSLCGSGGPRRRAAKSTSASSPSGGSSKP
jgi:integrase